MENACIATVVQGVKVAKVAYLKSKLFESLTANKSPIYLEALLHIIAKTYLEATSNEKYLYGGFQETTMTLAVKNLLKK